MTLIKKTVLLPGEVFVGSLMTVDTTWGCFEADITGGKFAEGFDHLDVDWGDGTVETFDKVSWLYHEYDKPGTYVVKIPDVLRTVCFSSNREEEAFGAAGVVGFASNAKNLKELDSGCFGFCSNLATFDIADAAIERVMGQCFLNCTALSARVDLPPIRDLYGLNAMQPFQGCEQIREIHFAAENEAAVKASSAYHYDPHLGAANATLFFDL